MISLIDKLNDIGIEAYQFDEGLYTCFHQDSVDISRVEWFLRGFSILYSPSTNTVLGVIDSSIPATKQRAFLKSFTDRGLKVRVSAIPEKISDDSIDTLYTREEIHD